MSLNYSLNSNQFWLLNTENKIGIKINKLQIYQMNEIEHILL